jgi:hypothetical protein
VSGDRRVREWRRFRRKNVLDALRDVERDGSHVDACRQKNQNKVKSKDCLWTGSSMVEQLTLNQRVGGSSPPRFTKFSPKILSSFSLPSAMNPLLGESENI